MWIKGGKLLNDDFQFISADLYANGEQIEAIGSCEKAKAIDACGCYVVPGFIDTHMHGAMGKTFIDFDADTFETIAGFEAKNGTTSLVPALSAAKEEKLISSIQYLRSCAENTKKNCAAVYGIHLEGPYFSKKYKGAHLPENIRNPDVQEFERLLNAAGRYLKIITMAPELPGADSVIQKACEAGVCVSAGHTDAVFEQVKHAFSLGLKQGTHLFNAMRPLSHREPGTTGALLSDETVKCELICDFVHIHPEVVKLVYRIKGRDKINLITDSEIAAGMPDGDYCVNGRVLSVRDKKTFTEDGSLAGGYSCLIDCVKNLVSVGIPLEDACMMASKNPAETAGVYHKTGSLTPGKLADILILNDKLAIKHVILRGTLIF